jgi:hypothetical protein
MHAASLAGLPGAGDVRSRRATASTLDYRGTFAFRREDENTIAALVHANQLVDFEGFVDGERKRLKVRLMFVATESGTVFFEASDDGLGTTEGDHIRS